VAHLRRKGEWLDEESEPATVDDPLLLEEPKPLLLCAGLLFVDGYLWESVTALRWFGIQGAGVSRRSYQRGASGNQFNLHAGVLIAVHARKQLEKPRRSMLCPPLAKEAVFRVV